MPRSLRRDNKKLGALQKHQLEKRLSRSVKAVHLKIRMRWLTDQYGFVAYFTPAATMGSRQFETSATANVSAGVTRGRCSSVQQTVPATDAGGA